ncbi:MAG: STAS domain-containing protein [Nitrospinae bacterium]|nr:STAS domain-containing protein [Nitrospinota bacterium]
MGVKFHFDESDNGVTTLAIHGEMDMSSSPEVRDRLTSLFKTNRRAIIVDLSKVAYIDSSGIATLVEGLQWSHASKNKFRLAGLSPAVRDVFEIARLLSIFETFASKEEAMEGV